MASVVQSVTGTPAEAATTSTTGVPPFVPRNVCETEMTKVVPRELWEEARVTLQTENGKGLPGIKRTNAGGSADYGCFQINDTYQHQNPHSRWLTFDAIYDPNYNARVAFNVYKANAGNWGPWYGPCSKGHEKLPKARCGR